MDSLTHGLFGLAVAATRRPSSAPGQPLAPTDRAVILACVIAAELPDLDYLWPADDPVIATLRAHRGLSHALVAAPAVALVAAGVAKVAFRRAAFVTVYAYAIAAVVLAHLLPDLWTGWGTRVLLPWSERRFYLDWTVVIDPLVTLPMLVGAAWGLRTRRRGWRRPVLVGLAVTLAYLAFRVGTQRVLEARVSREYRTPFVQVFPAPLRVLDWRYLAVVPEGYAAGVVGVGGELVEQRRIATDVSRHTTLPDHPVVREIVAWARWPVVEERPADSGGRTVVVGDLRYHLEGEPTLRFVLDFDAENRLTHARLDRGGSFRDLLARWRR